MGFSEEGGDLLRGWGSRDVLGDLLVAPMKGTLCRGLAEGRQGASMLGPQAEGGGLHMGI